MLFFLALCVSLGRSDWTFMSLGDWGGTDAPKYTTDSQCDAGQGLNTVAKKYDVDTILAVGDNFYHSGVTFKDRDKRFARTFNEVYAGPALQNAKFYAVAGNHDHRGQVKAQINYPNPRWYFPDNWYSFTKDIGGGKTAHFVMIDSVLLSGESFHDHEKDIFVSATGPLNKQLAQSQWEFIEREIARSEADFLFVAGHYPVYSPCSHGSTRDLYENLQPLLERHQVTAYIAGHDHCASFVDPGEQGGTVYPLNGMGNKCCYQAKKKKEVEHLVGKDALKFYATRETARQYGNPESGFSSFTLKDDGQMITRFHDQDGVVMWSTTSASRRAKVRLQLARSARAEPAAEADWQTSPLFLATLALLSCTLGAASTLCIANACGKPHNPTLQQDLMLEQNPTHPYSIHKMSQ
jgi:hypothetical protein